MRFAKGLGQEEIEIKKIIYPPIPFPSAFFCKTHTTILGYCLGLESKKYYFIYYYYTIVTTHKQQQILVEQYCAKQKKKKIEKKKMTSQRNWTC